MRQWVVLFLLMDILVLVVVLWWIRTRRHGRAKVSPSANLAQLANFARDVEPQVREYMAAFYGGDPSTLSQVLPGLASRVESQARVAGLDLGREALEAIIARTLAAQRIAKEREVHRAFEDGRAGRAG